MATIETTALTKEFGEETAVDGIDLTVDGGEVFGFLGPNGAGKSTTINLVLDFIRPTDGTVEVFGIDAQERPKAIRQRTGVLPEGYGFDDPLHGREYLEWAIETKGAADDPDRLLDRVGLTDDADRMASDYSKGMQQRLAFAMALVGDPDLLILDEPSTGLDPNGIGTIRDIVRERADAGATVFFSSHHLAEVEAVCDRVGVMNDGELVAVDTIEGLRESAGGHASIQLDCAAPPTDLGVEAIDGVASATVDERTLAVECANPGVKVDIRSETDSLEALFADLTEGGRDVPTDSETPAEAETEVPG